MRCTMTTRIKCFDLSVSKKFEIDNENANYWILDRYLSVQYAVFEYRSLVSINNIICICSCWNVRTYKVLIPKFHMCSDINIIYILLLRNWYGKNSNIEHIYLNALVHIYRDIEIIASKFLIFAIFFSFSAHIYNLFQWCCRAGK